MTTDIGVLAPGGFADVAKQDSFCSGNTCTISILYDQSSRGNHLRSAPAGGAAQTPDSEATATALPSSVGGHPVYAVFVEPGIGYRNDTTSGIATGDQPEAEYMVTSGTHFNGQCCFDYGNAEISNNDTGAGHMEAVYFGNCPFWGNGTSSGPWVMADLENGLFSGANVRLNYGNKAVPFPYVTAMVKGGPGVWAIKAGDAQSGDLTTMWNGVRPAGYGVMHKEGAVLLGIGGDNSNSAAGTFYEGVMTSGYPADSIDDAVQANIVAAGYGQGPDAGPIGSDGGVGGSGDAGPFVPACNGSAAGQTLVDDMSAPSGTGIAFQPTFTPGACGQVGGWFDYPATGSSTTPISPSPLVFSPLPAGLSTDAGVMTLDAGDGGDASDAEGGSNGPRAVCVTGITGATQYSTSGVGFNFATTSNPAGGTPIAVPIDASSHTGISFWIWGGGDAGAQSVILSLADLNETAGFGQPGTQTATGQLCNGGTNGVGSGLTACGGPRSQITVAGGWQHIQIPFANFAVVSGFGSGNENDGHVDPTTLTQLQWQIQEPVADASGVPYDFCIYGVSFY
jgi:hypothetical protein